MSDRHAINPYPLRIPQELRDRLDSAAKAGNRSLHAEILGRLEASFAGKNVVAGFGLGDEVFKPDNAIKSLIEGMRADIARQAERLKNVEINMQSVLVDGPLTTQKDPIAASVHETNTKKSP